MTYRVEILDNGAESVWVLAARGPMPDGPLRMDYGPAVALGADEAAYLAARLGAAVTVRLVIE